MLPVIKPGALLSIDRGNLQDQSPQPGELVAFQRGAGIVCHRYYGTVRIFGTTYGIEKGDYNLLSGVFRLNQYVGKVVAVDGNSAEKYLKAVNKPRTIALLWGLFRERFRWIFIKK